MPFPFALTIVCVALCASGNAMAAGRVWRSEVAIGHDSNLANIRRGGVEREAWFGLASIGTESNWPLGDYGAFVSQLRVEGQAFDGFEGLNHVRGIVQLRALTRPGNGFHVPTLAFTGAAAVDEFDSVARDGSDYRVSGFLLQPLTTRLTARVTVAAAWREAEATAFDTSFRSAALDLDWSFTNQFAAYAGYQFRTGDFVTTVPAVPAALAAQARAISPDDGFPGESAVRQDGSGHIGTLGVNLALSPRWSVDLQGLLAEMESDGGVRYRRIQTTASLLGRF